MAATYGPVFAAAPDATGGALALDLNEFRVAHAPVIDLVEAPDLLADALELPWRGAFRHGFCWGLLVPDGRRVLVVVMGHEGPDLAGRGAIIGRLPDQDARRFLDLWGGRAARVSLLIEATPGLLGVEVRYRTLAVGAPPVPEVVEAEGVEPAAPAPVSTPDAALAPVVRAAAEPNSSDLTPPSTTIDPDPEVEAEVDPEPEVEVEVEVEGPGVGDTVSAHRQEPIAEPEPEPTLIDVPRPRPEPVPAHAPEPEPQPVPEPAAEPDPQPVRDQEPEPVPLPRWEVVAEPEPEPIVVDPAARTPPNPPAGWFIDPFDAAEWRWWDGDRWSADTAPRSPEGDPTD